MFGITRYPDNMFRNMLDLIDHVTASNWRSRVKLFRGQLPLNGVPSGPKIKKCQVKISSLSYLAGNKNQF